MVLTRALLLNGLVLAVAHPTLLPAKERSANNEKLVALEVRASTIARAGRGLFAKADIKNGTLIRRSPYVEHNVNRDGELGGPIAYYAFGDPADVQSKKLIVRTEVRAMKITAMIVVTRRPIALTA